MSAGTITRHECGRLIIRGQRCVCDPVTPYRCDCTSSGNNEHTGDYCRSKRREAWARAIESLHAP